MLLDFLKLLFRNEFGDALLPKGVFRGSESGIPDRGDFLVGLGEELARGAGQGLQSVRLRLKQFLKSGVGGFCCELLKRFGAFWRKVQCGFDGGDQGSEELLE